MIARVGNRKCLAETTIHLGSTLTLKAALTAAKRVSLEACVMENRCPLRLPLAWCIAGAGLLSAVQLKGESQRGCLSLRLRRLHSAEHQLLPPAAAPRTMPVCGRCGRAPLRDLSCRANPARWQAPRGKLKPRALFPQDWLEVVRVFRPFFLAPSRLTHSLTRTLAGSRAKNKGCVVATAALLLRVVV